MPSLNIFHCPLSKSAFKPKLNQTGAPRGLFGLYATVKTVESSISTLIVVSLKYISNAHASPLTIPSWKLRYASVSIYMSVSKLKVPDEYVFPNGRTISSLLSSFKYSELEPPADTKSVTSASSSAPPLGLDHVFQSLDVCAIKSPGL